MDWSRAGVEEIDGAIDRTREDLALNVAMEHDAIAGREAALATVDDFNAIIRRCRDVEQIDRAEIDTLLDERRRICRQRGPSD